MSDVVDSDELLRRIQRARDWAAQEEGHWRAESAKPDAGTANEPAADIRASAYEAVRRTLDEIIQPGSNQA
ncbi:hypothetical protein ACFVYF_17265 [Streptomyces sp. NPDC058274]|uniref:hypothetical protein n=1 Tax=Streptomyces sp. NPDC058274 TaxID=3346416 RepID=UPI0036E7168C